MLVEPLGCSSSRWDVVQLSGCLYSLRGHEARDPRPVCHQSLLLSSHAGATSLLHSFLRHSFFFSLVFGASTLAAFLPPGSPLAPSGYPPVTPRLPRSLLYSCHFALSSHSVSLSPSVPLSISFALFPPLLLPFRSLLSFCLSVAVSPSLHFIRSLSPSRSHAF